MREGPVLAVVAVHLRTMWAMPIFFWRMRRLEKETRALPGLVRAHRWISRRSLLLTTWWGREEEARAWLRGPQVGRFLALSGRGPVATAWAGIYRDAGS